MQYAAIILATLSLALAAPVENLEARVVSSGTGDMTFYNTGLGSCGETSADSDMIVALSHLDMNNGANPNANPLCNKSITIHYRGKTVTAKVVDTCAACDAGSIDASPSLFKELAPESVGRLPGVTWSLP